MGICESSNSDIKNTQVSKDKEQNSPSSKNIKNQEDDNSNYLETHQSSNSQNDNKISNQEIQNNECPQLAQYERSNFRSEISYTNNNTQSLMSSGLIEEEIIIKGEINKNCKNKDEDFDNSSFKKLIKNNGGIIIKNKDQFSNISSSHRINSLFDSGKETISEIKSKHSCPFKQIKGNKMNINKMKKTMSENNKILNNKTKKNCFKINISTQDNYPFLNIPINDEPLPNIDELSEQSPIYIRTINSMISHK